MSTPQPPQPNFGKHGPPPDRLSDADWMALLGNDDLAPALLHAALQVVDPVPAWLPLSAQVAWRTRELDAELFRLLSESSSVGSSRSVAEDLRMLVFGDTNANVKIEVSIRHDVDGPVITGVLTHTDVLSVTGEVSGEGSGEEIRLSWQGSPPLRQESIDLDQFGRFEILSENATRARIRLVSGQTSTETLLITPWFDIY